MTFLDLGCVSRFDPTQLERLRRLFAAVLERDDDKILEALVAMGMLRGTRGFSATLLTEPLEQSMQGFFGPQPFRHSRELAAEVLGEGLKLRVGTQTLRLIQQVGFPPEYALVSRWGLGLVSVMAHLEATIDHPRLVDHIFGGDPGRPAYGGVAAPVTP
ncbi:MAG: hypothetical protein ACRD0U_18725 [Acidimicrobiales bacterium]